MNDNLHNQVDQTHDELTESEIARAVRHLRWRKEYAKRPAVVEARRKYTKQRQQLVRDALKAWRAVKEGGKP